MTAADAVENEPALIEFGKLLIESGERALPERASGGLMLP